MMFKIKCPKCTAESTMSFRDTDYKGPYRCWKCRALYTITLHNGVLQSCEPLSVDEFERTRTRQGY